jgi:hypothetical protein
MVMRNLLRLSATTSGYAGHAHFWKRALSRRQFLTTAAAGTLGLALGSGLRLPDLALADDDQPGVAPKPIPGGLTGEQFGIPGNTELFHVFPPAPGFEVSTITDFNGFVAAAEIRGRGTATDRKTGGIHRRFFDADMRFMQGGYIGVDGRHHQGTFGFI